MCFSAVRTQELVLGNDLSCDGMEVQGAAPGTKWADLRQNLSFYVGLHIAADGILVASQSEIFTHAFAVWRAAEVSGGDECVLGILSLKMLAFTALSGKDVLVEINIADGVMIHEVFRWLHSTLDWHVIA